MASQTTIYDVVTRYRVDDGASVNLDRISKSAKGAAASFDRSTRSVAMFSARLGRVARFIGPMAVVAGAARGIIRIFSELNQKVAKTIQLGAQFNLAFKFSEDPAENFVASMEHARELTRDIIKDAIALPGTAKDFFGSAAFLAGPVFKAGGDPADVRRIAANVALVAEFAGQSQQAASRQAFRMITGQTSIGDNPLFASLTAGGLLPSAEEFNALTLAERFHRLDAAMDEIANNPVFREKILGTLDVQLGALQDLLFGPQGLGGQLAKPYFDDFIGALTRFNSWLKTHIPGMVRFIENATGSYPAFEVPPELARDYLGEFQGQSLVPGFVRDFAGDLVDRVDKAFAPTPLQRLIDQNMELFEQRVHKLYLDQYEEGPRRMFAELEYRTATARGVGAIQERVRKEFETILLPQVLALGKGGGESEGERIGFASSNVTNNFTVKIDLKSDDSPEAIAVKFRKGIEKETRAPTRAQRGLAFDIGP